LSWLFNELFACGGEGVEDISSDEELIEFFWSLVGIVSLSIVNLISSDDVLFEVFSEEHQHIIWSFDVLRHTDHEGDVLLAQLLLLNALTDEVFVALTIEQIEWGWYLWLFFLVLSVCGLVI